MSTTPNANHGVHAGNVIVFITFKFSCQLSKITKKCNNYHSFSSVFSQQMQSTLVFNLHVCQLLFLEWCSRIHD